MFLTSSTFLLATGCPSKGGIGDSCDTSSECDAALVCLAGECANEPSPDAGPDAGADGGPDAGPPESIDELPVAETLELACLEGPADVVIDAHGIPHVYATSVHDVALVGGFMIARDRFVQLELGRRQASGRLAELLGVLSPSFVEDDIFMRVIGLRRQAQAVWDAVQPGSDVEAALEGYACGVNDFLAGLRAGTESVPRDVAVLLPVAALEDWSPVDSLTMGNLQSFALGYSGLLDAAWTARHQALSATFSAGAADPAQALRAGAAMDLSRLVPSRRVAIEDGLVDHELRLRRAPVRERPQVTAATLVRARHADEIAHRIARRWGRGADFGSNGWLLAGALTESGAPMMASDPHLGLDAPAVFYQVHLNTKRNGPDPAAGLNVAGVTFAGVPGVLEGFNEDIAWAGTSAYFDSTDVYAETLTPGAAGEPATVLFAGEQVSVQLVHEEVGNGVGGTVGIDIEWVPHHGPLAPIIEDGRLLAHTEAEALSIRWTGFDLLTDPAASRSFDSFLGAARARTVDDFDAAWDDYAAVTQNWVVADSAGNILWTTKSRHPLRDPAAMTFDPTTGEGLAPCFVLPGTGEAEWIGLVPLDDLPHARNPARGWVSTSNNDQTGHTFDGNPFDADPYLGWHYAESGANRAFRLHERLTDLAERGGVTVEDMESLQADHRSALGVRVVPFLLTAMQRASQEAAGPGTHPDLTDAVATAGDDWRRIEGLADRLAAWTFEAEAGVGEPLTPERIEDGIATSVFNVAMIELLARTLTDELSAAGIVMVDELGSSFAPMAPRVLLAMLEDPGRLVAVQDGESVLWDDLRTADVVETRDAILVSSLVAALGRLTTLLGEDEAAWAWGHLHTVRLRSAGGLLPAIPPEGDEAFPNGFPRHGDTWSVDASGPGLGDFDFSYAEGPVQRTVVELIPGAVRAVSVIAGGQSSHQGPHYADEMDLWRENRTHDLPIDEAGVLATWESRLHFVPN